MTEWYSAVELAGLPGLPGTDRSVERRALKEGWLRQRRVGRRGGGFEFHLSSLPAETQAHLKGLDAAALVAQSSAAKQGEIEARKLALAETITNEAARARRIEALKKSTALSTAAQQRLDAKLAILSAFEQYHQASGLAIDQAEIQFAAAYAAGDVAVDDATRAAIDRFSARSLRRWRNGVKKEGLTRLAGSYGNRKNTGKIDTQPAVRDLVIGMLVAKPHARASHVMQALRARLAGQCELPSLRSLERWMAEWKRAHAQTFAAIANPDAWKNGFMTAFGSASDGVVRINQRWEMDSTPADVMLTDGRFSILGVIDVYPRRAKLLVSKTSKAASIAALVRRTLLDWGVPDPEVVTDNGSDYKGHHMTRVFSGLGVKHTLCPPFQPWHKPHIERFFGTFSRDLVELLDGFIGHNVAERKAIEARASFADRLMKRGEVIEIRMSSAELQQFCDRWCEDIYMHRPHEGLDGKTPFEIVSAWRGPIARITDERALDLLLAEAPDHGMRTVQKKGIQIDGAWFIAPELEAFVGQQVQVRYDAIEQDLGRVYVFGGADLQFVCIAECPERTGIDRREVAIRARETQKRRVQEERRALKSVARAVKTDDIVDDILRERARAAGKLAQFPKRAETYESAGLKAAAEAAAALDEPQRTTADLMSPEEFAAQRARLEADLAKPVQPIFNTPFERAYWIAEQALSRALSDEEREFLERVRRDRRAAKALDELLAARRGNTGGSAIAGSG